MADTQPTLTPEFILTFRDMMLQGMKIEMQTTRRVLAAVPDSGHYPPLPRNGTLSRDADHQVSRDT